MWRLAVEQLAMAFQKMENVWLQVVVVQGGGERHEPFNAEIAHHEKIARARENVLSRL